MTKNFVYLLIVLMLGSIAITILFNNLFSVLSQILVMSIFVIKMKKIMSLSFSELKKKAEDVAKNAEKKVKDTLR